LNAHQCCEIASRRHAVVAPVLLAANMLVTSSSIQIDGNDEQNKSLG
jgi:hypothetical protein